MFAGKTNLRSFLFAVLAVGLLSASFHGLWLARIAPWNIVYSDVLGFFQRVSAPGFAYIDKLIEYPVITGLFIQIAGMLGGSESGYYWLSALLLVAAAVAATYILFLLAEKTDKSRFWVYWVFAPSMFVFSVYNWDMIAILFSLAAFYFMEKNKNSAAAFFIALGFCSKFFPALYLLPLLIKQKNAKEWIKIIAVFLLTALAVNGYFMIANFHGWLYFFELNSARNSNPDSVWTLIRLYVYNFSIPQINLISFLLLGGGFLWSVWRFRRAPAILLCFIGTVLFLLFNKVFSPQYVLWLLPFLVLLPLQVKKYFYVLEISNLGALYAILPWFFTKEMGYFYTSIPFVLLRHAALVFILISAVRLAKKESI